MKYEVDFYKSKNRNNKLKWILKFLAAVNWDHGWIHTEQKCVVEENKINIRWYFK